jgi:hypothetical protein
MNYKHGSLSNSITFAFSICLAGALYFTTSSFPILSADSSLAKANQLVSNKSALFGSSMIVKFKSGQAQKGKLELQSKIARRLFLTQDSIQESSPKPDVQIYNLPTTSGLQTALVEALNSREVEFAQPVYKYQLMAPYSPSTNPSFSSQWYLQDVVPGIKMPSSWEQVGLRKSVSCGDSGDGLRCGGENSVKVAVIDTGVNTAANDFSSNTFDTVNSGRFYYNQDNSCPAGQYYENLNFGTEASPFLINFCKQTGTQTDNNGHGTKVASIIGMNNNTTAGVGTAFNIKILPISLNGDYSLNSYLVADSVDWAVEKGAKVINLSLGTGVDDIYLQASINRAVEKGVIVVAAAGNCGNKTAFTCGLGDDNTQLNPKIYPASYPNVISVGAINYTSDLGAAARSSYSSYGDYLSVVVPVGESSGSPSGVVALNRDNTLATGLIGTSFAAPQVTGVMALAASVTPYFDTQMAQQLLAATSRDIGVSGKDAQFGYGLLDAAALINKLPADVASFQTSHYFTWNDTKNGNSAWTLVSNPGSQSTYARVNIANQSDKLYYLEPNNNAVPQISNIQAGPITVQTQNGDTIFTTQRVLYNGSFNEYAGISANTLTNKYYFTWNDTKNGNSAWTLVGNPSTSTTANVTIKIAGQTVGSQAVAPGQNWTPMFANIQAGPVVVESDQPIFATQRVLYNGSFNEFPGIPANTLTNKYYFTWNDTKNGNNAWTLVSNPSTTLVANVTIKIAGQVKGTQVIQPGQNWTPEFANIQAGPVEVTSDQPIFTTQRVIYNKSFNEFSGIPANTLTNKYYFTWNDTKNGNSAWTLVGNPSTTTAANVTIKIAGQTVGTQNIPAGQSWTPTYLNIQNGPVEVTSDQPVFATQRVLYGNSFNEMAGIVVP